MKEPLRLVARAFSAAAPAAVRFLKGALQDYRSAQSPFVRAFPAGHFYSPLPDPDEVRRRSLDLFQREKTACSGIDLCASEQLVLLQQLSDLYEEIPFPEAPRSGYRFFYPNPYFLYGEALVLAAMMRHLQSRRVIEIGSGFSSAAMLDINDLYFSSNIRFTFIEPFPERLESLLLDEDLRNHALVPQAVQNVDLSLFHSLRRGDLLFIDSSHVAKIGSDVVYLIHEILPCLQSGVVVHFHDVYWPFEYPREWVLSGRAWNEAYILRCFLQFNSEFRILYFNDFMWKTFPDLVNRKMPVCRAQPGSGLWLERA
jgi:hypothetical protein